METKEFVEKFISILTKVRVASRMWLAGQQDL